MPTIVLNHLSPFQKLHYNSPNYKFLKVFGCSCFPLLKPYNQHKLDFHTKKRVFISYSPIHRGYKCLDKSGRVFVARHVTFNEQEFPYSELFSKSQIFVSSFSDTLTPPPVFFSLPLNPCLNDSSTKEPSAVAPVPGLSPAFDSHSLQQSFSSQSPHLPSRPSNPSQTAVSIHPMITRAKAGIYEPKTYLAATQDLKPITVKIALANPKWHSAMKEEFEALQRNQTWSLVPSETAGKIVGNKWVFRVKYNPDGSISKYKARLVAKGYHQTHGIDFFETLSLVIKPCIVRIVLSLAVMQYWPIKQLV